MDFNNSKINRLCGSEILTSLDFEWSKRGWVAANGLDFEWDLKSRQMSAILSKTI